MDAYSRYYKVLKFCGFGRVESKKKWKVNCYAVYELMFIFMVIFSNVPAMVNLRSVFDDSEIFSMDLCSNLMTILFLSKVYVLGFYKIDIEKIRQHFRRNLETPISIVNIADLVIKKRYVQRFARWTKIVFGLGLGPYVFLSILHLIYSRKSDRLENPYPFPGGLAIYAKTSPAYVLVYIIQSGTVFTGALLVLAFNFVYFTFCDQLCAQFDILLNNVMEIPKKGRGKNKQPVSRAVEAWGDGDNFDFNDQEIPFRSEEPLQPVMSQSQARLLAIVGHHQAILKQINQLYDVYWYSILMQMACGAGLVTLVLLDIIIIAVFKRYSSLSEQALLVFERLTYGNNAMFDTFLYYYYASKFENKNKKLREAFYDMPWYSMDAFTRKICLSVIGQAHRPIRIDARQLFGVACKTILAVSFIRSMDTLWMGPLTVVHGLVFVIFFAVAYTN